MLKKILLFFVFAINFLFISAQTYAPAAGFPGSSAIHADSSIFVAWATGVQVERAYIDIAFPEKGKVSFGADSLALGKAKGGGHVVSLGDGGFAVLTFDISIKNGEGADFAVFENGFFINDTSNLAFLEFAYVSVSTNGKEYVGFPAVSDIPYELQQNSFGYSDAALVHNLAGKYTSGYGTPFDLDEIKELCEGSSVDVNNIKFIKITDVIGTISSDFCSYDSQSNIINDPYPTAFPSGGFDLDAIGVINRKTDMDSGIYFYPNPCTNEIYFPEQKNGNILYYEIYDTSGKIQIKDKNTTNKIELSKLEKGMYILKLIFEEKTISQKFSKY